LFEGNLMSKQKSMKTVLMAAALCALAGLANSAAAASCSDNDGNCQSAPINAGADRLVTVRCTINIGGGAPDLGNCKVIEVATGRFILNRNFRGDTGSVRVPVPTTGAYRCAVEANGPDRGRVFCSIT
jgi:hypothetical protein